MQWALASGNQGKLTEIKEAFSSWDVAWQSQADLGIEGADETAMTFVENAILKARHVAKMSGLPTLADDSGVVVDALNGQPGIYSARYAGGHGDFQANMMRVLSELEGVPRAKRTVRFVAVMVWMASSDDPLPVVATGAWEGYVAMEPKGSNGFGYDPIFVDPVLGITASEMTFEQKQKRSHRAKALLDLKQQLKQVISRQA